MLIQRITKVSLSLLLSMAVFSCGGVNGISPVASKISSNEKVSYNGSIASIDVGHKNGATLKFGIEKRSFKLKASLPVQGPPNSLAGNPAKEYMDVKSYKVWLIKNSSPNYPMGGDPIGDKVAGSFEINAKLGNGDDVTGISFNNVGTSGNDYYYMAVQAFDGELDVDGHVTGKSLIKQNNGSNMGWKGSSAYPQNRIAVSNGVKVDSNNQVSSLTSLEVKPMLEDGFGATVNSQFKLAPKMDPRQVDKCGGLTPESHVNTILSDMSALYVKLDPIDGTVYFLYDDDDQILKKINKDGTVSDVISEDIGAFAFDPAGNLYYTKRLSADNYVVMKRARGTTTDVLYAGSGATSGPAQDPRKSTFTSLSDNSIDFDSLGNLYIFVTNSGVLNGATKLTSFIAKVATGGNNISLFAQTYPSSITPLGTEFGEIKVSPSGYLYYADADEGDVYRYSLTGGGSGSTIFTNASSTHVYALEVDNDDALYFAYGDDSAQDGLYKLNSGDAFVSRQTILAPDVAPVYPANYLPASQVKTSSIYSLSFDTAGNLYYTETDSGSINVIYNDCDYHAGGRLGERISFSTFDGSNFNLSTMNLDGSGKTVVATNPFPIATSLVSPDGTKILYVDFSEDAYVINADGSGTPTSIATNVNSASWSPDGTKIVYADNNDVYTINSDGTGGTTNITNSAGDYISTVFSPDGTKIAYSYYDGTDYEIAVRNANGTGVSTILTSNSDDDFSPVWSPDGATIVYSSDANAATSSFDLYTMNATNGTANTRITTDLDALGSFSIPTSWSLDGSKIILTTFDSFGPGSGKIYTISPTGTNLNTISDPIESWTSVPFAT